MQRNPRRFSALRGGQSTVASTRAYEFLRFAHRSTTWCCRKVRERAGDRLGCEQFPLRYDSLYVFLGAHFLEDL